MVGAAPIARFATAWSAGVAVGLLGAPIWTAPLVFALTLLAPRDASARPGLSPVVALVVALGLVAAASTVGVTDCPVAAGTTVRLEGRFLASLRTGSAPFARADGCDDVTVVASPKVVSGRSPDAEAASSRSLAGAPVVVTGTWRDGRYRPWLQARAIEIASASSEGRGRPIDVRRVGEARWVGVRWRDGLVDRLARLYGPRAPLVSALVLARREGLDPEVRESFAVSGIAHLLAISGFHVGVIAGLILALLRAAGVRRRRAALQAAASAWVYVALIGFPDAASRAALILTFVALSRARGRPPSRWGALSAAGLFLLVTDPTRLASPGFQLSFAGAAGLVAWSGPVRATLNRRVGRALAERVPAVPWSGVLGGLAAGIAATAATLPIVAWHFERVSAVGIPVTLVATPLVTLALPGALASLLMDFVAPDVADFLAGGVALLLEALVLVADRAAAWPGASVWTSRPTVLAGCSGVMFASILARRPGIGGKGRRRLVAVWVTTAVAAWPVMMTLEGRGALEILMIDVGQGDAIGVRTPAGRWFLIDAGPPGDGDPASHPVVRTLRSRGVDRLETLILTHADADHFGGATDVLSQFTVRRVLDPAIPVPKRAYADLLAFARGAGVPWSAARAGQAFSIDGVTVRVLHPSARSADAAVAVAGPGGVTEANDQSVVVLVEWNGFRALLTGDAYVDVERGLVEEVGDIDVLKVGHHGSTTSTDAGFLADVRPELALISVGRRNRYGHPAPEVLARLEAIGAHVHRTDDEGAVRVRVGRDGTVRVTSER